MTKTENSIGEIDLITISGLFFLRINENRFKGHVQTSTIANHCYSKIVYCWGILDVIKLITMIVSRATKYFPVIVKNIIFTFMPVFLECIPIASETISADIMTCQADAEIYHVVWWNRIEETSIKAKSKRGAKFALHISLRFYISENFTWKRLINMWIQIVRYAIS